MTCTGWAKNRPPLRIQPSRIPYSAPVTKPTPGPRRNATMNSGTIVPSVTAPPWGISHSLMKCSTVANAMAIPISAMSRGVSLLPVPSMLFLPLVVFSRSETQNRQPFPPGGSFIRSRSPRQHYLDRVLWVCDRAHRERRQAGHTLSPDSSELPVLCNCPFVILVPPHG